MNDRPTLYLLGTGAAFSAAHRTTTMLAVSDGASTLAVDCGGDLVQRLLAAGLDLATLDGLLLTHEHIDHVGGFPLLVVKLWLAGRQVPLPVYGLAPALGQARRAFGAFDTSSWEGLPERRWHSFPEAEDAAVLENATWRVTASPARHSKPTAGFRIEHRPTGRTVAYSADTGPAAEIARLAADADVLVHEATGAFDGHATAAQAAEIAALAGARRLLLVHLPEALSEDALDGARRIFPATEWGQELGRYPV